MKRSEKEHESKTTRKYKDLKTTGNKHEIKLTEIQQKRKRLKPFCKTNTKIRVVSKNRHALSPANYISICGDYVKKYRDW